jgi:hypothetical protein
MTGLIEDLEEMTAYSSMNYQGQVPHIVGHATSAVITAPPTVPVVMLHSFLRTLLQSFSWPPFFVNIQSGLSTQSSSACARVRPAEVVDTVGADVGLEVGLGVGDGDG